MKKWRNVSEQELVEYLKENVNKIEDHLLLIGRIRLDDKANIIVLNDYFNAEDVIIYQLLSNIKAGFKYRNMRIYKAVKNQYSKEYIKTLINKCFLTKNGSVYKNV